MSLPVPRRGFTALAAALVVFLVVLVSCNDRSKSPAPITGLDQRSLSALPPTCEVGKIGQLALLLLPVSLDDPPFDLNGSLTTILVLTPTQLAFAQGLTLKLAAALGDDRILAQLRDPVTPPKSQVIGDLLNALFVCVQLPTQPNIGTAYTPGGAVAIVGTNGGTVTTRDAHAAIDIPAGTVTGDHLFTIAPQTGLAVSGTCLGAVPGQYSQCYDYSVSPADPFAKAVTIGMCTLAPVGNPPATPSQNVHERLRIASRGKGVDADKIIVYDRVPPPATINCVPGWVLADASPSVGGRLGSKLAGLLDKVTKPFRPTLAYAWDGCGALVPPVPDVPPLSNKTTIDPVVFASGFETAVPAWVTTGFWHRATMKDALGVPLTNKAYPKYVSLAPNDGSAGALPAPFAGAFALWYAEDATGNYAGALAPGQADKSGGTSVAPNSGTASSVVIAVPNTVNKVWLSFYSWFEIESVNPSRFDLMDVLIQEVGSTTPAVLVRLNPAADPGVFTPDRPYTSAGYNAPPVWQKSSLDLSAYRGKSIQLVFRFVTGDALYNAFRGWVVDEVAVKIAAQSGIAPSLIPTTSARAIAPADTLGVRPAHP